MKIFVGISGASGSIYGGRLLKALSQSGNEITVCISDGAVAVIREEEDLAVAADAGRDEVTAAFLSHHELGGGGLRLVEPSDMASSFASGSSLAEAAVICPCSMSTLASISAGVTRNLIHRVADVMLKESRPLVMVPRETPLSEIHLLNMLRARRAGALVVPAMPGFYHHPQTIEDLVDFVAGKVLDQLKIPNRLYERWEG
ncbi:MAG: UbiX family flavin prenyltransferase [Actinobacteria bacterium]|nr:UbiX family flavin prenyltransferase [Actinomycetota bacterium]MCL5882636.1 UbiX family flavin prenyltransferase [Actinomycetota bacterium]